MKEPLAILCSDIHLSEKPPIARSGEPDWFAAMARPLRFIRERAKVLAVPVVVAGDIFHKWKASPELINFALREMPDCYAVPGQHDLPYHDLDQIDKTAYGTLMLAGKVINLEPGASVPLKEVDHQLKLVGFPWGTPIHPLASSLRGHGVHLAVIHAYAWKKGAGYVDASSETHLGAYKEGLVGFDAAVFGDNHITFQATSGECSVLNCGSLMRRNSDQVTHRPVIGILYSDGSIVTEEVPIGDDILAVGDEELLPEEMASSIKSFVGSLADLTQDRGLRFQTILERYLEHNQTDPEVHAIIKEALDA